LALADVLLQAVKDAMRLSEEKYCPMVTMVKQTAGHVRSGHATTPLNMQQASVSKRGGPQVARIAFDRHND
jgi:hypothetical protein